MNSQFVIVVLVATTVLYAWYVPYVHGSDVVPPPSTTCDIMFPNYMINVNNTITLVMPDVVFPSDPTNPPTSSYTVDNTASCYFPFYVSPPNFNAYTVVIGSICDNDTNDDNVIKYTYVLEGMCNAMYRPVYYNTAYMSITLNRSTKMTLKYSSPQSWGSSANYFANITAFSAHFSGTKSMQLPFPLTNQGMTPDNGICANSRPYFKTITVNYGPGCKPY